MQLKPKLPPGRANRKALQFAADIHRLRSAGYTFSAIRMALLNAGISVGLSTIKREVARRETAPLCAQHGGIPQRPPSTTALMAGGPDAATARLPVPPGASGREIAEAFFTAHPSNPLFPSKEPP
jgi:hypothetical protein